MRIGIDTSRTAETKTGLGSYACSLLDALARIDPVHEYVLHPFTWHCFVDRYDLAHCPKAPNFRRARWWLPRRWVVRWWRENRKDKDWLVGGPHDVFFSPFHAVPPRHLGKLVCVFHDVAFFAHPEFSTDENRRFCTDQIDEAKRRADLIVTVSEFSRQEIARYTGIPLARIRAIHEAADPRYRPLPHARVPARLAAAIGAEPFVLYVGSLEPRKNLLTLVQSYAELVREKTARGRLVIAGGSGWKNSDVFAAIERLHLQEHVICTGFVSDEELVALYNTAACCVYPTLYEGFGLPVVEAMACGCPVITTRVASIPEVGGEAVVYAGAPRDVRALADAIARVLGDAALRADLRARGLAQAARFTWEATARQTLAVLEEVVSAPAYVRRAVVAGADERGIDQGWHALERTPDGAFRWIAATATLQLTPLAGAPLQLEVGTPIEHGQRLSVRIGNEPQVSSFDLRAGWQTLTIPGRAWRADRSTQITLQASCGLDARQRGSDPRDLALMVRRVGFGSSTGP